MSIAASGHHTTPNRGARRRHLGLLLTACLLGGVFSVVAPGSVPHLGGSTALAATPAKPTFGTLTNTAIGFTPSTMTTGDFTGHHRNDVLVAGGTTIKVLPNSGSGSFGTAVTTTTSVSVGDVAVGDLNGDGKLDIVAVNGGTSMYVLMGNGDGSFQSAVTYSAALFGGSPANLETVTVGAFEI